MLLNSINRAQPRLVGALSLGLLILYATVVAVAARQNGVTFDALELFPLGGGAGTGGTMPRVIGLLLGLALGWGVPGLSLVFLTSRPPDAAGILGRAFGLGFAYIVATSLAFAAFAGHAPHRASGLVILALPCALVLLRRGASASEPISKATIASLGAAALSIGILTMVLWPNLHRAALNGDGTEAYELARSLEAHPFPRWDLESPDPAGRFGIPVVVPFFTGAFLTFSEMNMLGRGELAARVPFVIALVIVCFTAVGLTGRRGRVVWTYAASLTAVYALWHAYYVTYEPGFPELAALAGSDTVTIALWLAGFREWVRGSPALGITFIALASATTFSAPVLGVLAIAFLCVQDSRRGWAAARSTMLAAVIILPAIAWLGWHTGDWSDWVRQIRSEYIDGFAPSGGRTPAWPLVGQLLLMTGALPIAVLFGWRRLTPLNRVLFLTGTAYLAIVLVGGEKNLHYLSPLPWIFLGPAVEVSGTRWRVAAIGVLAATFALSWPSLRVVRTENASLGRESCVQGLDYEAAALRSAPVYEALAQPPETARFAVGKHTFVRYALDLGGQDCVIGLSPTPPPGAIHVAGDSAAVWTQDVDRYARWRFHHVPAPSSLLFQPDAPRAHPAVASEWKGRLNLTEEPGRALLVSGFTAPNGTGQRSVVGTARLLVPVPDAGTEVTLGLYVAGPARVRLSVNGQPSAAAVLLPDQREIVIPGAWRAGWNILEIADAEGVGLRFIEATFGRPTGAK